MKTYCILEQGRYINNKWTLEKKELFTRSFCDHYRLNWKTDDDPNAFLTVKNIRESEGRSILYEKVPKNYEYYVFADEDVTFEGKKGLDIALKLKNFFDEYKPLTGTVYNPDAWHFGRTRKKMKHKWLWYELINGILRNTKKVHPICCYSPQVHYLSKSFADIMFPIPFHGAYRATHYMQWVCNKLFPLKQMCFRGISNKNNLHEPHKDPYKNIVVSEKQEGNELVNCFNKGTFDKSYNPEKEWNMNNLLQLNYQIAWKKVDKALVEFTLEDLAKIYDIHNEKFLHRKSIPNLA